MSSTALNDSIQYLICALSLLAIVKLWRTGLYRKYLALLAFLIFTLFLSLSILVLFKNSNSPVYRTFWEVTQPFSWLFSVWVVLELYSLILERHKGLATFGRWIQYAGFAVSTLISLLVMLPQIPVDARRGRIVIIYYYGIERGVDFGMLVFLLFILAWLTQYPVPLSRNVIVHSFVYTTLFLTNSIAMFARIFFRTQLWEAIVPVMTGIFALCVLTWLIFLTPKGEEIRVRLPRFSTEHEERVLEQLETLNRTLLKISKN
jgi:hypothetical protein